MGGNGEELGGHAESLFGITGRWPEARPSRPGPGYMIYSCLRDVDCSLPCVLCWGLKDEKAMAPCLGRRWERVETRAFGS